MSVNTLGFGELFLSFLLSTSGMIFMALLFLAAIAGLFRSRSGRTRGVCVAVICLCLAYAALILWMSICFGMNSHPPAARF